MNSRPVRDYFSNTITKLLYLRNTWDCRPPSIHVPTHLITYDPSAWTHIHIHIWYCPLSRESWLLLYDKVSFSLLEANWEELYSMYLALTRNTYRHRQVTEDCTVAEARMHTRLPVLWAFSTRACTASKPVRWHNPTPTCPCPYRLNSRNAFVRILFTKRSCTETEI